MRSLSNLWYPLPKELSPYFQDHPEYLTLLCEVELGLMALSDLLPGAPAFWLCHLLRGYTFGIPQLVNLTALQQQMLTVVRTVLLTYKNERVWREQLEQYQTLEDRFRQFEVDAQQSTYVFKPVTIGANRSEVYHHILSGPLPYQQRSVELAEIGETYICEDQQHRVSVKIPDDIMLPPLPRGHRLLSRSARSPVSISRKELQETARWMDNQEATLGLSSNWEGRLQKIIIEIACSGKSGFSETEKLDLAGMQNIVGMVSAGKSTLMDIIAVWAAQHGKNITLV